MKRVKKGKEFRKGMAAMDNKGRNEREEWKTRHTGFKGKEKEYKDYEKKECEKT